MRTAIVPLLALLATGCIKDELPVPAHPRGDARQVQVCMGSGYQDQVWYDPAQDAVVATNPKTAWDLAFTSDPDDWRVWLNGANLMTVWNTGQTDITLSTDTTGMAAQARIDAASGEPDSTAFGDWRNADDVYVVHRGFNAFGASLGLRKLQFIAEDADAYVFRTAALDGSEEQEFQVPRDPTRWYTYFSLTTNSTVAIEPPKDSWQLLFTQYTYRFHDPYLAYLVTGVLIQPGQARVSRIDGADFNAVSLADTLAHPFSIHRDRIGYDWKAYSFDTNSYTVDAGQVYIVMDRQGHAYKLHFLDFYNDQGQAGCPTFELQEL